MLKPEGAEQIGDSKIVSIVEAIKSVGPRNCSLISRMTGVPIETVRYKIKKQLLRKGIKFHAVVDYEMLGLKRYWLTMDFSEEFRAAAAQILDSLSKFGLTFYVRILPHGLYGAMVAIPSDSSQKYEGILDYMTSSGILNFYRMDPLDWVQNVSLRPEYYDFDKGKWSFSWSSLAPLTIRPNPLQRVPNDDEKLDALDLFILKELQINSLTHLTTMARKLGIGSKTLRYHYVSHVRKRNLLAGYAVRWSGLTRGEKGLVVLLVRVSGVTNDSIGDLEKTFLELPFTWLQAYSEENSTFISVLSLPADQYVDTLTYLGSSLPEFRERAETLVLDTRTVMSYTIPYEMFDADKGWELKATAAKSAVDMAIKRTPAQSPETQVG